MKTVLGDMTIWKLDSGRYKVKFLLNGVECTTFDLFETYNDAYQWYRKSIDKMDDLK